jgi:hypothetical protein
MRTKRIDNEWNTSVSWENLTEKASTMIMSIIAIKNR